MIESFKLSEKEKLQLIQIKKKTGIEHWNVLCRWAFCLSMQEPSTPPSEQLTSDSNVEMTWKTFGGEYAEIYDAILRFRLNGEKISSDISIYSYFRLHLGRGISYLNNQIEII